MSALEKKEENITIDHPKLYQALYNYMKTLGMDASLNLTDSLIQLVKRLKLRMNKGEGCYTNFDAIFIGLQFPHFTGDINEQFMVAKTIVGHEMGHILFTSQKEWRKFVHQAAKDYKLLSNYAVDVLNIVEDRRIERLMGHISPFLQKNFFYLGHKDTKNIEEEINEFLQNETEVPAKMQLQFILQLLLRTSHMRMIPYVEHKEIQDYVTRCFPYVLYAREHRHTKGAVKATEKIMEILAPLAEEYHEEETEKMQQQFTNKQMGTMDPATGPDGEGSSFSPIPSSMQEQLGTLTKAMNQELEEDEGLLDESGDDAEAISQEYVDDITGNLMQERSAYQQELTNKVQELEEQSKKPVTDSILHELLHSTSKTKQQTMKEQKELEKIQDLKLSAVPNIHAGHQVTFTARNNMEQMDKGQYFKLKQEMKPLIIDTAKELKTLIQQTKQQHLRFKKRGRIDPRRIAKLAALKEDRVFTKKKVSEEQMKMDIMTLIDISGSNGAQMLNKKNDTYVSRYVVNQMVGLMIHEVLKEIQFDHSVWAFHESSNTVISPLIERSNCHEEDAGLYLAEVGAKGCNRDGLAIRYAGKYLNDYSKNPKRLLFVISDGQPSAGGYGGMEAVADVKAAVEEIEKEGAKVIGIFTGHEEENKLFAKMYHNHLFVNNESIFELPKMLKEMLVREFQEHIRKF